MFGKLRSMSKKTWIMVIGVGFVVAIVGLVVVTNIGKDTTPQVSDTATQPESPSTPSDTETSGGTGGHLSQTMEDLEGDLNGDGVVDENDNMYENEKDYGEDEVTTEDIYGQPSAGSTDKASRDSELVDAKKEKSSGNVKSWEETPSKAETKAVQPAKEIKTPKGYVAYTNGLVNVQSVYPEKWYMTERSQDGLEVLKNSKGKANVFDTKKHKLKAQVPVVDYSGNTAGAKITIVLGPTIEEPKKEKKSKEKLKVKTEKVGKRTVQVAKFQIEEYTEKMNYTEYSFKLGKNRVIATLIESPEVTKKEKKANLNVLKTVVKDVKAVDIKEEEKKPKAH